MLAVPMPPKQTKQRICVGSHLSFGAIFSKSLWGQTFYHLCTYYRKHLVQNEMFRHQGHEEYELRHDQYPMTQQGSNDFISIKINSLFFKGV